MDNPPSTGSAASVEKQGPPVYGELHPVLSSFTVFPVNSSYSSAKYHNRKAAIPMVYTLSGGLQQRATDIPEICVSAAMGAKRVLIASGYANHTTRTIRLESGTFQPVEIAK